MTNRELLEAIVIKLDHIDQRLDKVEQRLDKVEQRLDTLLSNDSIHWNNGFPIWNPVRFPWSAHHQYRVDS